VQQPRASLILLGVTVAAWIVAEALGVSAQLSYPAGFIPARVAGLVVQDALPLWLTPLTATLLHAGILHLGFNMLMLGYCGRFVEYAVGSVGVIILYLIGAYAAALFQYLAGPASVVPMVGASGAVSALVGAYALLYSQRRGAAQNGRFGHWLHVLWLAAGWIFVQLLIGFATLGSGMSIAVAAHIGGFMAGLLLARPLLLWRYRKA
jgi:membrane associated rhomboid family serine protease